MSILARHLAWQTLITSAGVTALLILVVLGGRFTGYLADAAQGRFGGSTIFLILAMRLPEFLALLVPAGLYLGMALVCSRLVAESELAAWRAAGLTNTWLVAWALSVAALPTALVAVCVLSLAPWSERELGSVLLADGELTEFDAVRAGRFVVGAGGLRMAWAQQVSADRKALREVVVAEHEHGRTGASGAGVTIVARSARQVLEPATGSRFLVLEEGTRYVGTPGLGEFRVVDFDLLGQRVQPQALKVNNTDVAARASAQLARSEDPAERAEWHWRLSQIALVPLAALIVLVVLPITSRGGRSWELASGFLLYLGCFVLLVIARGAIEDGVLPAAVGAWPVIAILFGVALGAALVGRPWITVGWRRGVAPAVGASAAGDGR